MEPPFKLSALPREEKPTDYPADAFASAVPTPVSVEPPVSHIYMQDQQPSCGADLLTGYLNILFGFIGNVRFAWNEIRLIDHFSPDTGSTSATLATEAQKTSTCDLSMLTDETVTLPTNQYVNPSVI